MSGRIKKILFLIIIFPFLYLLFFLVYPNISYLKENNPKKTSFMKYRERQWKKKGEEKKIEQKWVPLSRISQNVVNAAVAAEDGKFWSHNGFDLPAMKEAFQKNLDKKQFRYGASTITQQLAKNLYLSPSKNPIRKITEAIITWRLEKTLDKKRIMELYLNVIEWGDGIFGIEAAARHYYGKSAASLSPGEAARLVAVLPNPIRFKVNGSSRYIAKRTSIILARMSGKKSVSDDELNEVPPEESEPLIQTEDIETDEVDSTAEDSSFIEQPTVNQQPEESQDHPDTFPDSTEDNM